MPFFVNKVTTESGIEYVVEVNGPYDTEGEAETECDRLALATNEDIFHTEERE